jgi:hypothetical protein
MWMDFGGDKMDCRTWLVTITNTGRAPAKYFATPLLKDGGRVILGMQLGLRERPYAVLPGEWALTPMLVPSDPTAMWTIEAQYTTKMSAREQKLSSWLTPFPPLRRMLPSETLRFAHDVWHSGTNVVTEH